MPDYQLLERLGGGGFGEVWKAAGPGGIEVALKFVRKLVHGNVSEWCEDRWRERYYKNSPSQDPPGPGAGPLRVIRGGGFTAPPCNVRAAFRAGHDPAYPREHIGFRVVRER